MTMDMNRRPMTHQGQRMPEPQCRVFAEIDDDELVFNAIEIPGVGNWTFRVRLPEDDQRTVDVKIYGPDGKRLETRTATVNSTGSLIIMDFEVLGYDLVVLITVPDAETPPDEMVPVFIKRHRRQFEERVAARFVGANRGDR
jgi:hypothetical protein